ncbi:MAG: sulfite exporter TauE/SafE family protein [Gemmatimonadaceae bacterium]
MIVLGYALAAVVGLSLGLMGAGGSILTVPIFVYLLGFDPKLAIAMSLPVVGATSLVGAAGHWKAGNVHFRTAVSFGAIAMIGSYIGARLSVLFAGAVQLTLLAVVMIIAAVFMFRAAAGQEDTSPVATDTRSGASLALLVPVAIGVGLLTGLVGTGGGFMVVPALVLLARVPITQAIGTSLLVIALNSVAGFAGYSTTVSVPWTFLFGFTAIAIAGILAGTYLVRFIAQRTLKRGFAVLLMLMGAFILYQSRAAFGLL